MGGRPVRPLGPREDLPRHVRSAHRSDPANLGGTPRKVRAEQLRWICWTFPQQGAAPVCWCFWRSLLHALGSLLSHVSRCWEVTAVQLWLNCPHVSSESLSSAHFSVSRPATPPSGTVGSFSITPIFTISPEETPDTTSLRTSTCCTSAQVSDPNPSQR